MADARPLSAALLLAIALLIAGCGGGSSAPHLSVTPRTALRDRPLTVSISGLAPHARAQLEATARDARGAAFEAATRIHADARGRATLRGNAAMRVLWRMQPTTGAETWAYFPPRSGALVRLALVDRGRTLASATVRRLRVEPGVRTTQFRPTRDGFYGELFEPADTTVRQPGVLLIGGSEGGMSQTPEAALLASHGYPSLAVAYFDEPGLPHDLLRIPLEYFARALHRLAREPGVDPSRLVVDGVSRGSEAAQLLGIHYTRLVHAVVALVPANGAYCGIAPFNGIRGSSSGCLGPAWTFRDRPIPYATRLQQVDPHPFPDERIDGPIFLDCGGDDALWASCPMAHAIVRRLHVHRFRHHVTLLDFPDGGHGVGSLVPYAPVHLPVTAGATPDANQEARAVAWPKLLAFLRALR